MSEKKRKVILTGDRPTGRLHIGHYVGSLRERVVLQNSGAFDDVLIGFEPVIRDVKLLQFAFSLSLGENGAPKYTGMLSVYRFRGEADTDFRALLAGYYNFDGSFSGYVPGIALVWGDMLIFETPYPRAERLE